MKVYQYLEYLTRIGELKSRSLSNKIVMFHQSENLIVIDNLTGELLMVLDEYGSLIKVHDQEWAFGEAVTGHNVTTVYGSYNRNDDITVIMEEIYDSEGEPISAEIKGFYHGEPDEESNKVFYGKLKATY
jgi:hypothetical protein